ncbi:MAG: FG-GAP-like repeat-containing protein [Bacteroidota bacterium]
MKNIRIASFLTFLIASLNLSAQTFERIEIDAQLNQLSHNMGVAVADYDLDNDLDLFVVAKNDYAATQPSTWSRLFRNNNDGTFTDMTFQAGFGELHDKDLSDPGWELGVKMGASWGDYDNDGYPDLFLTNYLGFQLFHNEGDGTFREVTTAAGLPKTDSCYNYTALWWDFDRDSYLDLFVPNWKGCVRNKFYQNNGDGTFTERAAELNLVGTEAGSLMSVPIDANEDGLWDIYIANDFSENELFIQNPDGTFTNLAAAYQVDYNGNDMGIAIGDYNNDGAFDVYVTNISENRLMISEGKDRYQNLAESKNVLNTYWGWDTRFADFDLDGDEDLFVLNGYESDFFFYPLLKENFYFKNLLVEGEATFQDHSVESQVHESSNSISMAVFDYDNDGDQDVFVANTNSPPFFYENKINDKNTADESSWVNIQLEGTVSNRDGLGSRLKLWSEGAVQHRLYYGAAFLSQSLQAVHFGLGGAQSIDSLEIIWNSGIKEKFYDLPVKSHLRIVENQGYNILDLKHQKVYGCTDPNACTYNAAATVNDGSCSYLSAPEILGSQQSGYFRKVSYRCAARLGSQYQWSVEGGDILSGQGSANIVVQWHLEEEGWVRVREVNNCVSKQAAIRVSLSLDAMESQYSIARLWNEALLLAIRGDFARPTVHARNLFHLSVAMYDTWAIYDREARPYLIGNEVGAFESRFSGFAPNKSITEARKESISFAAYRLLYHRFRTAPKFRASRKIFDRLMEELGYDTSNTSTDYSQGDPAALGNFIAETIINFGLQDGSNEQNNYANQYYEAINPALITNRAGESQLLDPNRWQPLAFETFIDQSGNFIAGDVPDFLSPEWGNVTPFSLRQNDAVVYERNGAAYKVFHDPERPPYLDTLANSSESKLYQWNFSLVSIWASQLTAEDGVLWNISPASIGNIRLEDLPTDFEDYPNFYNTLEGGDIGQGYKRNPVTGKAYEPQIVPRGDYARVLAEFWADGPDSETPPGHWFVILNKVNEHPLLEKRLGGKGRTLNDLEWDVKSYFILGGTMHDAAIAAWSVKGWYDYIRPISAIRYMAARGQSSDPALPNYDVAGIPLEAGLVEIVQANDPLAGVNGQHIGKIKLYTWRGHGYVNDPATEAAGVGWILAENWMPYQRISFVTPPFAGYVSGHSTFSRAAAEAMTLLTGDPYFPGGVGEFIAYKNEFLVFEEGPSQDVILQWASYRDASDQCSLSRIWGGIHPPADDLPGRWIGAKIGTTAFAYAVPYFSSNSNELNIQESLLFPNPTSTDATITLTTTTADMKFILSDAKGQVLPISNVEYNPNLNCTTLSFYNLSAGVYTITAGKNSWQFVVF